MNTKHLIFATLMLLAPCSMVLAENSPAIQPVVGNDTTPPASNAADLPPLLNDDKNWYFSWGYSRQWYAPSDIHVTQPSLGNNFTVHQAKATDYPANIPETIDSIVHFNFFMPQENIRVGKFMDAERTFAIEFSLDHSKYNTDTSQSARISGTINNQPFDQNKVLDRQYFYYALHNGLNHVMLNAVWLKHLNGPQQKPGDLELISRAGAGILLPHAKNTIFGQDVVLGPKWENSCCTSSNDWWQLLGWTAGVEVGVRYRMTESFYAELTAKEAYGILRKVPVYQGNADQEIWMTEGVLSVGYLF